MLFNAPTLSFIHTLCVLQGRIVTLRRFFDSDQKQIEKIYRYQIWLEIGLNSLYSSVNDSGRQPLLLTLFFYLTMELYGGQLLKI